jgi:hypothetical protein
MKVIIAHDIKMGQLHNRNVNPTNKFYHMIIATESGSDSSCYILFR